MSEFAVPPSKQEHEKFCVDCGAVIKKAAEICPRCGVRQQATPFVGGKNRIVAGVLALCFGGFGVHKFYLGRPIQGLLYLVFCWTFIPFVISFIEAILYFATYSDEQFAAKYR